MQQPIGNFIWKDLNPNNYPIILSFVVLFFLNRYAWFIIQKTYIFDSQEFILEIHKMNLDVSIAYYVFWISSLYFLFK